MTPKPQQEYIINEPDVEIIEVAFPNSSFVRHLRSRPTPSAPTFCDKVNGGYECAGVQKSGLCPREATIRNQVLDEAIDIVNHEWNRVTIIRRLRSLRRNPEAQQ